MVHLAAPASAVPVLSMKLTETVVHGIDETEDGTPSGESLQAIVAMANSMQALLVGPGISHHPETSRLVRDVVSRSTASVVLDADGINAYKDCAEKLKDRNSELILTPHEGEWRRVFAPLPAEPEARIAALCETAREFSMIIVYKGNPTLVVDNEGKAFVVALGNSGMASAGSGDVLSGILVSLVAQGCRPGDAALLGASIHGLAGACASAKLTQYSVIAGDIVGHIHEAVAMLAAAPPPVFFAQT